MLEAAKLEGTTLEDEPALGVLETDDEEPTLEPGVATAEDEAALAALETAEEAKTEPELVATTDVLD